MQKQRQRRDSVELRHVNVEHDHVGIDAFDLVDRFAATAQRADQPKVWLLLDPTPKQAAHHHGIIDHHDADGRGRDRTRGHS